MTSSFDDRGTEERSTDRSAECGATVPVRAAVLCPRALARAGLCRLLDAGNYEVVWEGGDGRVLVDTLDGCSPDLILLAWDAPGAGVSLIEDLIAFGVTARIVIMTPPDTSNDLSLALDAGAVGCLSCNSDAEDFLTALKMLTRGNVVVSHDVAPVVTGSDAKQLASRLTPRELQVLVALGRGATNREIAEELHLSPYTVKIHVHKVLARLGFRNRQQAAAYVASRGIR